MFLPYFRMLLAALCLIWAQGAQAEALQPLPELSKSFDLVAYAATTETVKKEFPGLPNVAFEISLPKSWPERIAMGQSYGEIARFDGPAFGDVRPYFSFKRIAVNRENSAKNELISYLLRMNYVLRAIKERDDRNVEALYVIADPQTGDSFVIRAVMRIMGPEMLLAEYALPMQAWDKKRDEQTFAISSFKFLKDSTETIEKRIERSYFKQLRFHYPASWFFEGESAPVDNRVTTRLVTNGETGSEAGRIHLTLVSPRSLKDTEDKRDYPVDVPEILKEMRKTYTDRGYDVSASVESFAPDLNIQTAFGVVDVYNLSRRVTNYETDRLQPVTQELWVAVFRGTGPQAKTYIAEMLTPSRNQDLYQWAVNTRAFKIILKSIQ